MYNANVIVNFTVLLTMIIFISLYGLDMKEPYPYQWIELYSEPYVRVFSYLLVYALSLFNNTLAIVYMIGILLLHIDYNNLVLT